MDILSFFSIFPAGKTAEHGVVECRFLIFTEKVWTITSCILIISASTKRNAYLICFPLTDSVIILSIGNNNSN